MIVPKNPVSTTLPKFYRAAGGLILENLLQELDTSIETCLRELPQQLDPGKSLVAAKELARNLGWAFMLDTGISPVNPGVLLSVGELRRHNWQAAIQFWFRYFFDKVVEVQIKQSLSIYPSTLSLANFGESFELTTSEFEVVSRLMPAHMNIHNSSRR